MKSVLISIQPYWVFLIIAKIMGWEIDQEKIVEVRKNFPKDLNWNGTSIIYCSKNKQSFNRIPKKYQTLMEKFLGNVIGEFVCNKIVKFENSIYDEAFIETRKLSCVPLGELLVYIGTNDYGYGWHISDLVIYDKPRELSEFVKYRADWGYRAGIAALTGIDCNEYITRPPQSWCYVEDTE